MILLTALLAAPSLAATMLPGSSCARPSLEAPTLAGIQDKTAEYEKKREQAGKEVQLLWNLYLWCDANGMEKEGRSSLRAILREDDTHRAAHEALGHIEYDGQWFTSEKKLEQYKKEEAERMATEKGLVRYKGDWVPKEHLPYLEKGLTQDGEGNWVNREELEKTQAGWVKQDTVWISPEEIQNIQKGLWKCGDGWMTPEEANRYHSEIGRWWIIPSAYFTLYTTCDREVGLKAIQHMETAYRDLNRALGGSPAAPVTVALFRDLEQYGQFAAGSDGRLLTDARGLSSIHSAYFADTWFMGPELEFMGAGVGYWDASTNDGNAFGPFSARHAAAQSLIDVVDPSPKALASARKARLQNWNGNAFWAEKKLPEWYRFGVASYAERYFIDQFVAQGGNHNWAREWSIQNLMSKGGLRSLKEIFTAKLNFETSEDSKKLLNELGLVMAFVLDGKCAPVAAKHGAVKHAVRGGDAKEITKAMKDLENAITENEKALLEFAGI
jgi:hypothetical protein